jgi:SAM-dependent methyltransferase
MKNAESYYNLDYDILIDSEEEDQLLVLNDGKEVFRFEHQLNTLLDRIVIPLGGEVLDFGCAKATTLKLLSAVRDDISPFVFDVSEMYEDFWGKFISRDNQAVFDLPTAWLNKFDVVTSFFSLEHAADAIGFVESVSSVLKEDGTFYCIVPDWRANIGDIVVVDHANHFSIESLSTLLSCAGFVEININRDEHPSALVATAKKGNSISEFVPGKTELLELENELCEAIQFWERLSNTVASFERNQQKGKSAIYGSGFYGAFVASLLADFDTVECFLDKNPFRQGKALMSKPILDPLLLPRVGETVYVALNPAIAEDVSIKLAAMWEHEISFCVPRLLDNAE